jgi:hypothetical protein
MLVVTRKDNPYLMALSSRLSSEAGAVVTPLIGDENALYAPRLMLDNRLP